MFLCRSRVLLVALAFITFARAVEAVQIQESARHAIQGRDHPKLQVVPLPKNYTTGNTVVCLSPFFHIILKTRGSGSRIPSELYEAIRRTENRVRRTSHQYLSPDRGLGFFTRSETRICENYLSALHLEYDAPDPKRPIRSISEEVSLKVEDRTPLEKYRLVVPVDGPATLSAESSLGLLRGLTTFEQLFYSLPHRRITHTHSLESLVGRDPHGGMQEPLTTSNNIEICDHNAHSAFPYAFEEADKHSDIEGNDEQQSTGESNSGSTVYTPFAPYEINDEPSFGWRAVLLDTSRHYFSAQVIKKQLDTMSTVKLNVFQWMEELISLSAELRHITDSNSWPLFLKRYPELAQSGAYTEQELYTEEDIRDVVEYAGKRGIDVILEIDTPGHTAIIAESHPDYIACNRAEPWSHYAHQPPAGQLRFASGAVHGFISGVFESAMALTKSSYFGTGGDEINVNCMLEDPSTVEILREKNQSLNEALNDFTLSTHGTIRSAGRIPIVWQEMALDHGLMPSLEKDTIVTVWKNSSDAQDVLNKGYRIIHAAADYFYLDCGQGGWIGRNGGGDSWCDPFKSWARIYSFDPFRQVKDEQKHLVLGGQVSLWTEQTDESNLEITLWPRAAALAELVWTGPTPPGYPRSELVGVQPK